jgi:hypothetical protein
VSFNDFTLLPADDPQSSPDEDLAAAAQGALAITDASAPVDEPPPQPFGLTWQFDWQAGQFVRIGQSPAQSSNLDAVAEWCQAALHSARYAHPIFSDVFGMESPDGVIGEIAEGEALADWQRSVVDALLVHDRITSVENISLDWDPSTGILTVLSMDVVTDEDQTVTVSDVTLQAGGA